MRPVQRFSSEYLESSRDVSADEVVRFLDGFRKIHGPGPKSRLISMRVSEPLLESFRAKCKLGRIRYQTRIKELMLEWLESGE